MASNIGVESEPSVESSGIDRCIICSGELAASSLPGLVQCSDCEFITTNLDISDEQLSELYGEDYFHGQEYLDYSMEAESLRVNFDRRISELRKLVPDLSSAAVFEIGCAYGFFLQQIGDEVGSARGIDISEDAVRRAVDEQKVDARASDYLTFDIGEPVDVITMWDTIEHLRRPDLFVAKAARDLKPGGHLAITTGDIASINARMRGKSWRMIHPPTHLHYFSVATLRRLLEAKGFDVVHVSHPGNSRKLRSVLYALTALKGNFTSVYDSLHKLPIFDINLTVNLFDIMYVVARRRSS